MIKWLEKDQSSSKSAKIEMINKSIRKEASKVRAYGRSNILTKFREVKKWTDLVTVAETEAEALEDAILAQEKCTKQFVLIVSKIVKFPLNLRKESQSIAKSAIPNIESFR